MHTKEIRNKIKKLKLTNGNTSAYVEFDIEDYAKARNIAVELNKTTDRHYFNRTFENKVKTYREK